MLWIACASCGFAIERPYTDDGPPLASEFSAKVDRTLDIPENEQQRYADLLRDNLRDKSTEGLQYVVLVDRNPYVQALMIYWIAPDGGFRFIGAAPISTGKPGEFDHFITPTGVFEHTPADPDFRAQGTRNEFGIRGYGAKGMRVFDFGWQTAVRGWDGRHESQMRLQLHATDPDYLEPKLGTPQSKGCIRIPTTLDEFLDHYGILDRDYGEAVAQGQKLWVLPKDGEPTPWPGRYLVVVDTNRIQRPDWSRAPEP